MRRPYGVALSVAVTRADLLRLGDRVGWRREVDLMALVVRAAPIDARIVTLRGPGLMVVTDCHRLFREIWTSAAPGGQDDLGTSA